MYIIYKLISDKTNQIYIGSTKKSLRQRLANHKKSFKNGQRITSRKLFELGGNIEIIELMKVNTKHKELILFCESVYIKLFKDICINKNIPGRTHKQYYKDNIEEITKKKSLKNSCECGGQYRQDNKSHHEKTTKHIKYIESLE